MSYSWIFDQTPASRSRRGGNPAEFAFEGDLETFVREVVQNANDQGTGDVGVEFAFRELRGQELSDFLETASWRTLEPHLRAASDSPQGASIAQTLDQLERREKLLLLRVEDRYTVGLTGDEYEDESHFTALCKDTLYSHKQRGSAGGSYGLGKSVLWSFSGLSSVLFSSNLHDEPPGKSSPRLIGRTELPSHELRKNGESRWYTGSGWFGEPVSTDGGHRAESVWGRNAERLSERLWLSRPAVSGTSILILGFRDPTEDTERPADDFAKRIRDASVKFFWPALVRKFETLRLNARGTGTSFSAAPDEVEEVAPFADCYRGRQQANGALEKPGDVVRREIEFDLPGKREGSPRKKHKGRVTLLVRWASSDDNSSLQDHVAMFRGSGMVVRYWRKSRLAVGARPFHAVVIAGHGHEPSERNAADNATEEFLRASEPPGHDKWQSTKGLKEEYKRGYKSALDDLHSKIRGELQDLVTPKPSVGQRGPDKLRKRFPLKAPRPDSPNPPPPTPFHFEGLSAVFREGRWLFSGKIRTTAEDHKGWTADVSVTRTTEDNRRLEDVPVCSLNVVDCKGTVSVLNGQGRIEVEPDTDEVDFEGETEVLAGVDAGEIELGIQGHVLG